MRGSSRIVDAGENRLLAALPQEEFQRLMPSLHQTSFRLGDVIYEFGGRVYFPTTAIVSLLYTMETAQLQKWD